MKTLEAWEMYVKSKPLSPYTISNMSNTFKQLSAVYPELPMSAYEVNVYLTSLKLADTTVHMHRRHIVSVYKLFVKNRGH